MRHIILFFLVTLSLGNLVVAVDAEHPNQTEHMPTQTTNSNKDMTIVVSMPSTSVPVGQSLVALVTITNSGNQIVKVTITNDVQIANLLVTLRGKSVSMTAYGTLMMGSPSLKTVLLLSPGEHTDVNVPLTRSFDMSLSGTYEITAQIAYGLEDETISKLNSKPLSVTITEPKSEKH